MVFSTPLFLFYFLALTLLIYYIVPRKWRNPVLLCSSLIFYYWGERVFVSIMFLSTAIDFTHGLIVERCKSKGNIKGAQVAVASSILFNLALLCFFKYWDFLAASLQSIGLNFMPLLGNHLPIGISFYTFQSMSYTLDVYRKQVACEKNFVKLALYISFFPQLVAGPIVKSKDFIHQLYEDRNINWSNFKTGIQIFVFGLFKKIVIADNISICVDAVFGLPQKFNAISIIMAVIGYSIQIYCDFSGYSDMAIGSSKILGYDLMRNFNMPYVAKNISTFWKRWHISLSTWLQEYLYISLGGNRKGEIRTYINLFLTMLIGGLWHGASWTFVAWGALHGVALCAHKICMKLTKHDKNYKGTMVGNICSVVLTYIFVSFCWIFFRAENFEIARNVIWGIISWQDGTMYISSWTILGIVCVLISTFVAYVRSLLRKTEIEGFYLTVNLETVFGLVLLFVAIGVCFMLAYTGSSPFIYFQF